MREKMNENCEETGREMKKYGIENPQLPHEGFIFKQHECKTHHSMCVCVF